MIKWLFFPVMLALSTIGILAGVGFGLWLKTFPGNLTSMIGNFTGSIMASVLGVMPLLVYTKMFGDD